MTKTEVKHDAQDWLMLGMRSAFQLARNAKAPEAVLEEMEKQFHRAEKLYGYVEGSTGLGV